MSEELDDLVDNIKEPSAWLRLAFMVVFALVLYLVIAPIILVLMLAQALFSIITGDDNNNLRKFGAALSQFIYQILQFLTFNSDDKPFPFAEFPGIALDDDIDEMQSAQSAKKSAAKNASKKTAKKKAPRKSAAKKTGSSEPNDSESPE